MEVLLQQILWDRVVPKFQSVLSWRLQHRALWNQQYRRKNAISVKAENIVINSCDYLAGVGKRCWELAKDACQSRFTRLCQSCLVNVSGLPLIWRRLLTWECTMKASILKLCTSIFKVTYNSVDSLPIQRLLYPYDLHWASLQGITSKSQILRLLLHCNFFHDVDCHFVNGFNLVK